jgi:hypothetical protein
LSNDINLPGPVTEDWLASHSLTIRPMVAAQYRWENTEANIFGNYQKQTFNIPARTTINFDVGNFDETFGEVSLIMVQAEYLPHLTVDPYNVIYWNYKNSPRYVMGEFMVLTGAIKTTGNWYGWQVDPTLEPEYDGITPGFVFTNPTDFTVRISILTAN